MQEVRSGGGGWDEDGNGLIAKSEFAVAMPALGLDVPRADIDFLFDSFDGDGSGEIDYHELNKALRAGGADRKSVV